MLVCMCMWVFITSPWASVLQEGARCAELNDIRSRVCQQLAMIVMDAVQVIYETEAARKSLTLPPPDAQLKYGVLLRGHWALPATLPPPWASMSGQGIAAGADQSAATWLFMAHRLQQWRIGRAGRQTAMAVLPVPMQGDA